jgi:CCR4-NOT transcription complex subunit 3
LRQQQLRQQQEAQLRQQQEALRQQQQAQQEALQRQQQQQEAQLRQQQQEAAVKQQQQQQAQQAAAAAAAEQKANHQALQQQQQQQQAQLQQQVQQQQQMQAQAAGQANALDILTSGLGGLGLGASGAVGAGTNSGSVAPGAPGASAPGIGGMDPAAIAAGVSSSSYLSALNDSFTATPNTVDNDRSRNYTPQNPYALAPASYPSAPSPIFENPDVFEKLGTDALFFIFYYAQGTYQQYLAARELKKQSWRFHKKYMTWFQRHQEPKITTDEYEQGTYVYFDYETGWCPRLK